MEIDKVGPAEMDSFPSLLTPTPSCTDWMQLEGSFSIDRPPKPFSQLVDKFKKQNEESRTLEKEIENQIGESQKRSQSEKSPYEKLAREALV